MLFFFIMNLIFILGAEFNNLIAYELGSQVEEKEHSQKANEIEFSETRHPPRDQQEEE